MLRDVFADFDDLPGMFDKRTSRPIELGRPWPAIEEFHAELLLEMPDLEAHGWESNHSVVVVIARDMPFLLDSVRGELNRRNATILIGESAHNDRFDLTDLLPSQTIPSIVLVKDYTRNTDTRQVE